ncbi:hypothetical protein [Aeoliella mucimassa]|uniref:Uncharacterized protein n=1 Tax=Aeoliella mucimassa TaxID=2527972 RepID=A0A518AJK8_9BACT|nr:hypothetical protein [Aeoliella mucimassa]QDU54928.1 hypothetical protein Pan181_11130 [Aeoliella mucimassa]
MNALSRFGFALVLSLILASSVLAQETTTTWRAEVLLAADFEMGSVSIGDLDPALPGNEVVVATQSGEAWMLALQFDRWVSQRIAKSTGEILMGAIGDADPTHPGNEFVGVGMVHGPESLEGPGQATMAWKQGDDWHSRVIYTDDRMLHGVGIGDVDKAPGTEVIVTGFSHRVQVLKHRETEFAGEVVYVANDRMKVVLPAEVLAEHSGLELLTTGSDGCPQVLWQGELGWCHQTIMADPWGQSRITSGPAGIVIGGDGGKVTLATRKNDGWQTEVVGRDTAKIRGVVLSDLDPAVDGPEIYSCGYSGRVLQFTQTSEGYWQSRVIHSGDQTLHHLLVGEFDARHEGPELVTCGHGGKLIALYPEPSR